jgi:hypothetical protein
MSNTSDLDDELIDHLLSKLFPGSVSNDGIRTWLRQAIDDPTRFHTLDQAKLVVAEMGARTDRARKYADELQSYLDHLNAGRPIN